MSKSKYGNTWKPREEDNRMANKGRVDKDVKYNTERTKRKKRRERSDKGEWEKMTKERETKKYGAFRNGRLEEKKNKLGLRCAKLSLA